MSDKGTYAPLFPQVSGPSSDNYHGEGMSPSGAPGGPPMAVATPYQYAQPAPPQYAPPPQQYAYAQPGPTPYQVQGGTMVTMPGAPTPLPVAQPAPASVMAVQYAYMPGNGQGLGTGRLPPGAWSDNICDCCTQCETCLTSWFCAPYRWARTAERARLNTFGMALLVYGLPWLLMIIFGWITYADMNEQYAENKRLHREDWDRHPITVLWWGAVIASVCNILQILLGMTYRLKLRTMYSIPGTSCEDCLLHTFCRLCAVAQEARHVDRDTGFLLV